MIFGIGTDIIEVERIRGFIGKGEAFKSRVFTEQEIAYSDSFRDPAPFYAARFSAKEAFVKALGTGFTAGIGFNQIEVTHLESGQPEIILHGKALEFVEEMEIVRIHLTLTHIKEYAIATVILEL